MTWVQSVGVIGAGLMGRQIAWAHAVRGVPVRLFDACPARTTEALAWVGRQVDGTGGPEAHRPAEVRAVGSLAAAAAADLVIEAVVEDAAIKRAVLSEVEAAAGPRALITSNTSSIPLSELAVGLGRRGRFCGLHFCHPVSQRPLVEVIGSKDTAPATLAAAADHMRRLGLSPLAVPDRPGFLLNRLLAPYLNAAVDLLARGAADLPGIESAARAVGMPVGPFTFLDAIGIDTAVRVGATLYRSSPERLRPAGLLVALFKAGQFGEKTGAGFFRHDPDGRPPQVNPILLKLLDNGRPPAGSLALPAADVIDHLRGTLTTEVARAVDEGIVTTSGDAWRALALGVGFREDDRCRPAE